jgi:hypothetical protein
MKPWPAIGAHRGEETQADAELIKQRPPRRCHLRFGLREFVPSCHANTSDDPASIGPPGDIR